jgi:prepilin-type N-terminal cleavage/methylation domain-containing protein
LLIRRPIPHQKKKNKMKNQKGITVIEMMVAVAIIACIVAIFVSPMNGV